MTAIKITSSSTIGSAAGLVGLKTCFSILDKWSVKAEEAWTVLGMKKAQYYKARKSLDSISLSSDQIERISYVLNIHQALRVVFTNPENVYGYMTMPNDNHFFNGDTPLSVTVSRGFAGLYDTYRHIDTLRGGGW